MKPVLKPAIALLGLAHRPPAVLFYGSAVILVLSVAAIASLARLGLGRRPQRGAGPAVKHAPTAWPGR